MRLSIPTGQGRITDASATGGLYSRVAVFASFQEYERSVRFVGRWLPTDWLPYVTEAHKEKTNEARAVCHR